MIKKVEIISAVVKVDNGDKKAWEISKAGIYNRDSLRDNIEENNII